LLVSRHHGKLYAPGDYKDDKSFLRTLSKEELENKLNSEIEESLPEVPVSTEVAGTPANSRIGSTQRMVELRNELRTIESAVVSKFEIEFGIDAQKDVAVGDTGVSFDALFSGNTKLTFLEVKSARSVASAGMILDRVLYSAVVADRFLNSNFKLILAIVYHFEKQDLPRFEAMLRKRIEQCPAAIEVRLISRSELIS